jgi:uncharacterized protein YjbJ (UPF0337 family)
MQFYPAKCRYVAQKAGEFKWRQTCQNKFVRQRIVREGDNMNWDQIEGKWKQFLGSGRERWGKLTDNDWETIAGKKDQLVGRIQVRYGVAKAEAEKQTDEWSRALTESGRDSHAATRL